jgi:phage tail sheath gpL-like
MGKLTPVVVVDSSGMTELQLSQRRFTDEEKELITAEKDAAVAAAVAEAVIEIKVSSKQHHNNELRL